MSAQPVEPGIDRRGFIKALALVTAAAAAGGGAAAVLKRPGETVVTTFEPAPPFVPTPDASSSGLFAGGDLTTRLAVSQAENMRLQAALAAAERRLAGLESSSGDASRELETLRAELANANDRAGLLGGLVALYEQLDELDLDTLLQSGLDSVGQAFDELSERVPSLQDGLAVGSAALDNLESEIPFAGAARDWAEQRAQSLTESFQDAQEVLASVLDSAGDFLEMLGQWFQDVLKWVPFGMGEKAASVVSSLTGLLQQTPETTTGLRSRVAQPLDVWLQGEGEELALRRKLIRPLREQTLAPAGEVIEKTRQAHQTYVSVLSEPVQETTQRREAIRRLIGQYREHYQV